ncbi:MAG: glyoxylate/hydroxypyruvate reductase A [Pseudomonadota bacterium]
MIKVHFSSRPEQAAEWSDALKKWRDELSVEFSLLEGEVDPEEVEALILNPRDGAQDLSAFAGARLIQSIWAGVEALMANPTLPDGPTLCRMSEPGLTEGMTDYVCGHVLRHHLDVDRSIRLSAAGEWRPRIPPLSRDRKVGILGLGALGEDAARMLARLRFDVAGWSRRPKSVDGVLCRHGADGLDEVVARSEILVTILPLTDETRHVLNARTLALAPEGAVVINPGRGPLIDDDAMLAALDAGRIAHATLDVFAEEPLPEDHPYWGHPQVTVTPHIAAETRTDTSARVAVEQIGRLAKGEPLLHIVDRSAGY